MATPVAASAPTARAAAERALASAPAWAVAEAVRQSADRARLQRIDRGRRDKEWFARYYLAAEFTAATPGFHATLDRLVGEAEGDRSKPGTIIAAPRGSAKTTRIALLHVLWSLLYRRHRVVVIASKTQEQADERVQSIRFVLETNERIRGDFGDLCGSSYRPVQTWQQNDITLCWPRRDTAGSVMRDRMGHPLVGHTARLRGVGTGVSVRGMNKPKRPDLIVCQPAGETVLTAHGLRPIESMKHGDLVMTHGGHWAYVASARRRTYSGKLVSVYINGSMQPVRMTAEHQIWCLPGQPINRAPKGHQKYRYDEAVRWLEASRIEQGDLIVHPIDSAVLSPTDIEAHMIVAAGLRAESDVSIVSRDAAGRSTENECCPRYLRPGEVAFAHDPRFWRLVGYWLGDGTLTPYGVSFTFGLHEQAYCEDIASIAADLFGRRTTPVASNDKALIVNVSVSKLRAFFASMRLSARPADKSPLCWMERLPQECQRQMLLGYYRADGNAKPMRQDYTIVSASLPMMQSFQRMAWRLGLVSSIRVLRPARDATIKDRTIHTRETYDLRFNRTFGQTVLQEPTAPMVSRGHQWIRDGFVYAQVSKVESESVEDIAVYNISVVHGDRSYTGNHIATHNCDDLENDEHVSTQAQREKTWAWWSKVIVPLPDARTGTLVVVGTILHYDSLLSRLLKQQDETGTPVYRTALFRAVEPDGTYLWPEVLSPGYLEGMKRRMGTHAFNQEYLNNPLNSDSQIFRPQWWRWYTRKEVRFDPAGNVWRWRDKPLRIYLACDPAIGQREADDEFVICCIGVTAQGEILVLDLWCGHLDFPAQVKRLKDAMLDWLPEATGIEVNAYQEALRAQLAQEIVSPIRRLHHHTDKQRRIAAISPYVENGQLYLRAAEDDEPGQLDPSGQVQVRVHPKVQPLFEQASQYPASAKDDRVDCLAMCLETARTRKWFSEAEEAANEEGAP